VRIFAKALDGTKYVIDKKIKKIDRLEEIAKLSGVSYDTISKVG